MTNLKLILASHGKLAVGMKDTLEMIAGKLDNVEAYEAYSTSPGDEFIKEIEQSIKNSKDEAIIIVTDVLGGSVNNEMTQLMIKQSNVYLITGMNFPLLITLATQGDNVSKEDVLGAIDAGKKGISLVNDLVEKNMDDEEDIL